MKNMINVSVWKDVSCVYDLPSTPDDFLAWWKEKFDLVPVEYRETTRVDCETHSYYDSTCFSVDIYYMRPETDEEEAARIKAEEDRKAWLENQELCQLENLRKKYGI